MKILIVSQYFWPENFRVNDLAAELAARGHAVTVLTGKPNYPEGIINADYARHPGRYAEYQGVEIIRVPLVARGSGALRLSLNYLSFLVTGTLLAPFKLAGRKYDAIFVFGVSPVTAAIPAIVLKWIKRAPLAIWVLDLWPESLSAVGAVRSRRVLAMVGAMVRAIYRNCDVILAQSRSFIDAIHKYCAERGKIRYFPNWSEDLFSNAQAEPAPELERRENMFTVMFAGNIGEAQDFPTILAAAEQLRDRPDIRWVIVGDGRMAHWVRQQLAERGLERCVVMTGRFPLERMPSFFAHADALLVSLKATEIFAMTIPGKLQSYLSFGLPVIGTLDGEGAAVIRDSGAGYACRSGDAQALAAAVSELAGLSAQQRRAMGAAGKAYYLAEFEKMAAVDRLEDIFRNLCGNRMA